MSASGDVFVRLEAGRGIISISEPFDADYVSAYDEAFRHYSEQFAALPLDLRMYGTLASLGGILGIQPKEGE